MDARTFAAFRSSLTSRRGALAQLGGGLLGAQALRLDTLDAEARKKKGRRKKKRKKDKARTSVTAACPGPSTSGLGDANDGNVRIAQTFTAEASGALVQAELEIRKGAGTVGDFVLRLAPVSDDGSPSNAVLEEAIVDNFTIPEGATTLNFAFADPEPIKAGTSYALVLTRPGGGEFGWASRDGDACGGQTFFSPDQTSPFFVPFSGFDFIFTAFVRS